MYDKTPWEKELLKEHLEVIEEKCMKINDGNLKRNLSCKAIEIFNQIGKEEVIYAGIIYTIKAKNDVILLNNGNIAINLFA